MTPGRSARVAVLTFVLVALAGQLAVGMRAARTSDITGDEPFYLLTTQSLVSDGDLDLRDEYATGEVDRFWRGTVPLWKQMAPMPDGRLLSPHDPLLSVVVAPAYEWFGVRGVQRFLVLLWAAAMAIAALVALRFRAPPWAAVGGAVVVGAGPPGIVYASQIYPEGPAALCVALALLLAAPNPTSRGNRPGISRPISSGVALAAVLTALAWFGVKYVPVGAVLGVAWAWRHREDRRALAATAALVTVSGAAYVWWHLHTFDGLTPYATNVVYSGEGSASIIASHVGITGRSYRLYGLFLDARFGLLRWLPAAAIAVWGLGRRTVLPAAVFAVGVLMGAFVSITMMGWWFPGRMLVAGFPALVVLLALGAARLPRPAVILGGWSLAIAAALVWAARTGGVHLAVDPFDLGLPLAPAVLFPDFRSFGGREVLTSLAWILGLLGLRLGVSPRRWSAGRARRRSAAGR